jgi:hypothetical protein
MGYWIAIASLAQIVWIFLFQYRLFALSVVAIVAILLPLLVLYWRLGIALQPVSQQQGWLINFPLSIYFAWISVATIVNIAIALYSLNWNGWGISPIIWTVIMMVIGASLAFMIRWQRQDGAYTGVFIWALLAICIKHLDNLIIAGTAGGLALILVISILIGNREQGTGNREQG